MARIAASRIAASRRLARQREPVRRDPGLFLAVTLIIALAPIGWINAIGQIVLPTNLPTQSAPTARPSESRRGGATLDVNAISATSTPTVVPPLERPGLIAATPVTGELESPIGAGVTAEPAASATPVAAGEVALPAASPTVQRAPTVVPTQAVPESPTPVPATPTAELPTPAPTPAPTQRPTDTPTSVPSPTPRAAPAQSPGAALAGSTAITYVVQAGDTLWSIASRYGVDLARLRAANQIGEDNAIRVGQTLIIPRVDGRADVPVAGDLLNEIAQELGLEPAPVTQASSRFSAAPVRGEAIVIPTTGAQATMPSVRPTATTLVTNAAGSAQGELRSASRVPGGTAGGSLRLQWPALGGISTFFGEDGHSGLDIMGYTGQPVTAAGSGVVTNLVQSDAGYGWRIDVDHGGGIVTLYAHLSEFNVSLGDRVSAGQRIGSVGNTGLSTGPHLHFEVRTAGHPVDPLDYLR